MGNILSNGTFVGVDGLGNEIRVGDLVDHLVKPYRKGVLTGRVSEYKGEIAFDVDYPTTKNWLNRFSQMVKHIPTLADFGYKVGDLVWQKKYQIRLEITSSDLGTYKGEPCCYTDGGRPTRFSQIEPYNGQDEVEEVEEDYFEDTPEVSGDVNVVVKDNTFSFTLGDGRTVSITIQ